MLSVFKIRWSVFLSLDCKSSLLGIRLYQTNGLQTYSLSLAFLLFFNSVLWTKVFCWWSPIYQLFLLSLMLFCHLRKKFLPKQSHKDFSLMLSSWNFIFLSFPLGLLVSFIWGVSLQQTFVCLLVCKGIPRCVSATCAKTGLSSLSYLRGFVRNSLEHT